MTTLNVPIQLRRGNEVDCPTHMLAGEVYVCLDSGKIFAGTGASTPLKQLGGSAALWGGITGTLSNQTDLQAVLTALAAVDTTEASTRAAADTTLQGNITSEASTRATADSTEATVRAAADTALQSNITSEANTRATADSTNATAISTETTRAQTAEALAEVLTHKDAASGYAGLDASSFLKIAEIPPTMSGMLPYMKNLAIDTIYETQKVSGSGDGVGINYTVPVGKRAMVSVYIFNPLTAVAENVFIEVKVGGTGSWYQVSGTTSSGVRTANNPTIVGTGLGGASGVPIFEPGDLIALNSASGVSYFFATIWTFDVASPIKSPKIAAPFTAGSNVVYTAPVGKKAYHTVFTLGDAQGVIRPLNNSGGVMNRRVYKVPSGGNPTIFNQISPIAATTATAQATALAPSQINQEVGSLAAGDQIVLELVTPSVFVITSVATASAGSTVYTGTFTGGGANAFANASFTIKGFQGAGNNVTAICTASSTTTITLTSSTGVSETAPAFATVSTFTLSATANASAGSTVYTGVFPIAASNAYIGHSVVIAGFSTSANNGTFQISASTTTTITVNNASGAAETKAATATWNGIATQVMVWLSHIFEF